MSQSYRTQEIVNRIEFTLFRGHFVWCWNIECMKNYCEQYSESQCSKLKSRFKKKEFAHRTRQLRDCGLSLAQGLEKLLSSNLTCSCYHMVCGITDISTDQEKLFLEAKIYF